jgi:hypothetical protein
LSSGERFGSWHTTQALWQRSLEKIEGDRQDPAHGWYDSYCRGTLVWGPWYWAKGIQDKVSLSGLL